MGFSSAPPRRRSSGSPEPFHSCSSSGMRNWNRHTQQLAESPPWRRTLPTVTGWPVTQAGLIGVPCPLGHYSDCSRDEHVTLRGQSEAALLLLNKNWWGRAVCHQPRLGAPRGRRPERTKPVFRLTMRSLRVLAESRPGPPCLFCWLII